MSKVRLKGHIHLPHLAREPWANKLTGVLEGSSVLAPTPLLKLMEKLFKVVGTHIKKIDHLKHHAKHFHKHAKVINLHHQKLKHIKTPVSPFLSLVKNILSNKKQTGKGIKFKKLFGNLVEFLKGKKKIKPSQIFTVLGKACKAISTVATAIKLNKAAAVFQTVGLISGKIGDGIKQLGAGRYLEGRGKAHVGGAITAGGKYMPSRCGRVPTKKKKPIKGSGCKKGCKGRTKIKNKQTGSGTTIIGSGYGQKKRKPDLADKFNAWVLKARKRPLKSKHLKKICGPGGKCEVGKERDHYFRIDWRDHCDRRCRGQRTGDWKTPKGAPEWKTKAYAESRDAFHRRQKERRDQRRYGFSQPQKGGSYKSKAKKEAGQTFKACTKSLKSQGYGGLFQGRKLRKKCFDATNMFGSTAREYKGDDLFMAEKIVRKVKGLE